MTPSLNEVEAIGKRAARGAGFDWGLAEEAGKAARWLTARDLPGPEALAALLAEVDGAPCSAGAPAALDGRWTARGGGPLCPLAAGAVLADLGRARAETGRLRRPLLLLPALALAARAAGRALAVAWPGLRAVITPDGTLSLDGAAAAAMTAEAPAVSVAPAAADARGAAGAARPRPARHHGRAVYAAAWAGLERLAHRTYAPATERSRLAGAGAGLTDND
jgi:hypothetical protein